MNPDPFVFHPSDVAMSFNLVVFHQQHEGVWNSDRTRDLQTCPETETLRTMQLIVPLSNAITPGFRVRRRTFFRLSDIAMGFDARAIKKESQYCNWVSLSAGIFDNSAGYGP